MPNCVAARSGAAQTSHSTANIEENGSWQAGQRWSSLPPHAGQASPTSLSNSSNQRWPWPQSTQTATQWPSTFRRSSRSQSDALPTARL